MKRSSNYSYGILFLSVLIFLIDGYSFNSNLFLENEFENVLEDGITAFMEPYGEWFVENDQLVLPAESGQNKRTNIWLHKDYEDFILELDFKLAVGTNSGIFLRTTNTADPVQTGIEVQIRDDYGKSPIDKSFNGSIYDITEVSENRVKKPGEWNQMRIISKGTNLQVFMNKKKVTDIDLMDWDEVGKNPDGTKNKFKTAYKDMARKGKIGFQDHGGKVWYRAIRIKEL